MIWELVRRDPAWRFTPLLTGVVAVACTVGQVEAYPFVAVMVWLKVRPHERATFLETSLPIAASDLFLGRLLALLCLVWLPVAATVALRLIVGKPADGA